MSQLVAQLQRCEEAVRNRMQLGIETQKARRLEDQLAKRFSAYFASLSRSFPWEVLPSLMAQRTPEAAIKEDAIGDRLLKAAEDAITAMLAKHARELALLLKDGIRSGFALGAEQAYKALGLEADIQMLAQRAVSIANASAASKVVGIDKVTTEQLRALLSEGVRQGWSVPELARQIKSEFSAMADAYQGRAHAIARTELASAVSDASMETYKEFGVAAKSWLLGHNSCEVCIGNANEGIIPLDQSFSSGDDAPPAHPNCTCAIVPELQE